MANYTYVVVDDERDSQKAIWTLMEAYPNFERLGSFDDVESASVFLKFNAVDVLFLDLEINASDGFSLLQGSSNMPLTIVVSGHVERALEAFDFEVFDFVSKPLSISRFSKAILKATNRLSLERGFDETDLAYIKSGGEVYKLEVPRIKFVKSIQNYIVVNYSGKNYIVYSTISGFHKTYDRSFFVRIHKSYIVNVQYIDRIAGGKVYIGRDEIPISRMYKWRLDEAISKFRLRR